MTDEQKTVIEEQNRQLGIIAIKQWEILRRFKEKTLPFWLLRNALNSVIRGRFEGISDTRFRLYDAAEIIIPNDYDSVEIINSALKNDFRHSDTTMVEKSCSQTVDALKPGAKYIVKKFWVRCGASASIIEVSQFMKFQGASFVGAQGELLLWRMRKDMFTRGRWTYSLDKAYSSLTKDQQNNYEVPPIPHIYPGFEPNEPVSNKSTSFCLDAPTFDDDSFFLSFFKVRY